MRAGIYNTKGGEVKVVCSRMTELVMDKESEGDLHVFKGLEGFEDVCNSDDSVLVALLDDLQEETLMTLLDDDLFSKDLGDNLFNLPTVDSYTTTDSEKCVLDAHSTCRTTDLGTPVGCIKKSGCVDVNKPKRRRTDAKSTGVVKRTRLEGFPDCARDSDCVDLALAHVMHDHCYASTQEVTYHSGSNSDEETGNEEGSSSDTGKRVYSVKTQ